MATSQHLCLLSRGLAGPPSHPRAALLFPWPLSWEDTDTNTETTEAPATMRVGLGSTVEYQPPARLMQAFV